jgi:hypothetical protein
VLAGLVQQGEDPRAGGRALLELLVQLGDLAQGPRDGQHRRHEEHQVAGRPAALQHLVAAPADDDHHRQGAQHLAHGRVQRPQSPQADGRQEVLPVEAAEAAGLVGLAAEGLDHAGAGHRLLDQPGHLAHALLDQRRVAPQQAPQPTHEPGVGRHDEDGSQGQAPVDLEDDGEEDGYHEAVAQQGRRGPDDGPAQGVDVVDQAAHEHARLLPPQERQGQSLQVPVKVLAHVQQDPLLEPVDQVGLQVAEEVLEQEGQEDDHQDALQPLAVPAPVQPGADRGQLGVLPGLGARHVRRGVVQAALDLAAHALHGRRRGRPLLEEVVQEGHDQGHRDPAQEGIDDDGPQGQDDPPPVGQQVAQQSQVDAQHEAGKASTAGAV